jgi:hypothetical protein
MTITATLAKASTIGRRTDELVAPRAKRVTGWRAACRGRASVSVPSKKKKRQKIRKMALVESDAEDEALAAALARAERARDAAREELLDVSDAARRLRQWAPVTSYVNVDGEELSAANWDSHMDAFVGDGSPQPADWDLDLWTIVLPGTHAIEASTGEALYRGEVVKIFYTCDGEDRATIVPHGEGRTFDPLRIRSGTFKLGRLHGAGMQREYDAATRETTVLAGTFDHGRLHGTGCERFASGALRFCGAYAHGVRHGAGSEYRLGRRGGSTLVRRGVWTDGVYDASATRAHDAKVKREVRTAKQVLKEALRSQRALQAMLHRRATAEALCKRARDIAGDVDYVVVPRDALKTCVICLEACVRPVAYVRCGHSICGDCADNVRAKGEVWTRQCPTCKVDDNDWLQLF